MSIFDKIIGSYSTRQIKKIKHIVDEIESMAGRFTAMPDNELRGITEILRGKLANGASENDILPEAFAAVREAATRTLGKRPFMVQLMGGIILHQGRIAEMKTGEGKTLVATMPAYLNALCGNGVHIVTVNEYLARMGYEEMGRIYNFLGLTTGLIIHDQTKAEKQKAYNCDITYGTNNEFGFDYLRDNMVVYKKLMVQRGHVYAIVDEVDSILIDEARTPLIISGEGEKSTDLYDKAEAFVKTLREHRIKELDDKETNDDFDADYIVDEKARTTIMTAEGIKKAERHFKVDNFSDAENSTLAHHVQQAIRAHGIMHLDVDYVVKEGAVLIVDSFTGRIMPGRRFSDGLHQAIEAKEHVKIEKENKTCATITFQNYFRMYKKLSGMTGTALTEETEFREIYNLDVVEIPTNMPMIREDHEDLVYKNQRGKYTAIINQIKECNAKGQPVLVGTVSIDKSEILSKLLTREGIAHTVLNAKHHEKEAEIVAQAGTIGTVTISTNMAGRGTDIMLGGNPEFFAKKEMRKLGYEEDVINFAVGSAVTDDEILLSAREEYRGLYKKLKEEIAPLAKRVCSVGGLYIIGTERHESRRIDNQLRGRSGRQGDPGESKFFLALDDDLMRLFGSDRVSNMVERLGLEEDQPIAAKLLTNSIENAQKQIESRNFTHRKNVLDYDDVMNQQRTVIYNQRREVLDDADVKEKIKAMIETTIDNAVDTFIGGEESAEWNFDGLRGYFFGLLCNDKDFIYSEKQLDELKKTDIANNLKERALKIYADKEDLFGSDKMREIERVLLLRNVDLKWMDHIDAMDDLRGSIGLQAYAQRNPISEYRIAGADMFDEMIASIREDTMRSVLSVVPAKTEIKREEVAHVTGEGFSGGEKKQPIKNKTTVVTGKKVGRNDPCPCGSGKKYKKCCGFTEGEED